MEAEVFIHVYGCFIELRSGIVGYLHSCLMEREFETSKWYRKAVNDTSLCDVGTWQMGQNVLNLPPLPYHPDNILILTSG